MNRILLFFGAAMCFASASYAQGGGDAAPPSAAERGGFGCDAGTRVASLPAEERSRRFPEIQEAALRVNAHFCAEMNDALDAETPPPEVLIDYGRLLTGSNLDFGDSQLSADVRTALAELSAVLGEFDPGTGNRYRMPDFDVTEVLVGGPGQRCGDVEGGCFSFNASVSNASEFAVVEEDVLQSCVERFPSAAGDDPDFALRGCFDVFQDLERAVNSYKRGYQAIYAQRAEQSFEAITRQWNRFFEQSRSMTFADLLLTSLLERKNMRVGYIEGPPRRQWFALHPNVTLQYVDGAPKGDQLKPGLSIEWFGVNWWDESPLGFPLGVSLTTVYADAPQIDTVGHGITLHVDNRFTFGWAKHGSDNSFHVSADLLSLFEEKKEQFEKYRERVEKLR